MTDKEEKDRRKLGYAYVLGELEGEGYKHDSTVIKGALGLNPESPIEKVMRAKVPRDSKIGLPEDYKKSELREIGEDIIKAQDAFAEGYFEGMPKRRVLTKVENEEIERYGRLLRSNDPRSMEIAQAELQRFYHRKVAEGVCPDVLREKVKRESR